jgi:hypothetical protein
MSIPFERFFNITVLADTFGLIPFLRLWTHLNASFDRLEWVVALGLGLSTVAFLVLRPGVTRIPFPAAVAVFLVLSGYTVHGAVVDQAAASRAAAGVSDPSWVDHTVGRDERVAFLYGPTVSANPHLLWQSEFWNRSVKGIYVLNTDPNASYSNLALKVDAAGRLVPINASIPPITDPYVLADPSLGIVGQVVAQPGPLALIRADPPARVARTIDGVYADGWTGPSAALSQYAALPAGARSVRVRVSRAGWTGQDVPSRVTLIAGPLKMTATGAALAGTTSKADWVAHSGLTKTFDLRVPRRSFRIEVKVDPTFSPAQFGQTDPRQLGVQLAFEAPPAG